MNDLSRLRIEYERRKQRLAGRDLYSWFNPATLFAVHQRQRATLSLLKRQSCTNLAKWRILEVGCGSGGILTEFLCFGTTPQNLYGVDLLFDRLLYARQALPGAGLINADGQSLPYSSAAFDLVLQYTAISSVLDADVRRNICADMLRVLKPGGVILSYDFWLNPTNPQTHGIRPAEIKRLFPDCKFDFQRITLAPPITRRLVPISWLFCTFLEKLKIFNSHYLVAISKVPHTGGTLVD